MVLTFEYQNLRSIRARIDTFFNNILNASADVIGVTETWLNDGHYDSELSNGRYNVFRSDRPYELTNTTRGGGCALLVKSNILATRIFEFESHINFIEDLWLQIQTPDGYLYISLVYITSMSNNTPITIEYLKHLDEIVLKLNSNDKVIIFGDFNIREIDWIRNHNGFCEACNVNSDNFV